jgi:porphyrinogen peroxidase
MQSKPYQPGILQPVPALAQHQFWQRQPEASSDQVKQVLRSVWESVDGKSVVLGLGASLSTDLRLAAPRALKPFAAPEGSRLKLPQTPADLWLWLRSKAQDDQGIEQAHLLALSRKLHALLAPAFDLKESTACFRHGEGRDLTGYEDGTENPKGKKALSATFAADGSSFVALQKWQHQWHKIEAMSEQQRDHAVGRVRKTNAEIEDAPDSAHVKRTAQEDFILSDGSEGFSLRRSMPWSDDTHSGLMFTSFGKNFEAFEAQLAKMVGAVDGVTDAIFRMSKPVSGAYFWCPPLGFKI